MKLLLKVLNVVALLLLLASCLASYINPNLFWQFSFIGFAFPVVLVVNICFLLLWFFLRQWFVLVPLAGIALAWNFIEPTVAFNFFEKQEEKGLKVLTWNVKNFDLYNWSHNVETRSNMMELIRHENADVLCLQEFYSNNQTFHNLEYLRDTLGYTYCYFPPAVELTKNPKTKLQKTFWKKGPLVQKWGVATFSKFPITDTGVVTFNNTFTNRCIYSDVNFKGKTIRVYNVHFQSIHLGYDDYTALDEIEQTRQTSWAALKGIMRKMKRAFTKRALQANAVQQSARNYDGQKIILGDFNDVPVSYTYKTVRQELKDAFIEKGKGFGPTFAKKLSIFRIDYVFCSKEVTVNSYKTIRNEWSDHYPVVVTLSL
jgi:endonuclease/exonuclease/phosphatase family metal-dependent hydrolase